MASGLIEGEEKSRDCRVFPRGNPNKKRKKLHRDEQSSQTLDDATEKNNAFRPQQLGAADSDDSSGSNPLQRSSLKGYGQTNGASLPGYLKSCKFVRLSLDSRSEHEIRELKRKLMSELDQVKSFIKRVEAKEIQIHGCQGGDSYAKSQLSANEGEFNKASKLMRVNSEVGSVGVPTPQPLLGRGVSVADSNNGAVGEFTAKERINPNVRGMDKFPQTKNDKRMKKPNIGTRDKGPGFGDDKELLKSCKTLLTKLKNHKLGWVFNKPVDAEGLGLHDYFIIVKHPMDLGTVENRLNKNWYKSPREFAEDVRLTFRNAMLYNPKGQDVHYMAETLLRMFEEKWVLIEKKYNLNSRGDDMALSAPSPTLKKKTLPPPLPSRSLLPESRPKPPSAGPAGRQMKDPVQKKPLEKESEWKELSYEKKEMSYVEKQRLSDDLSNLPSEKLEEVVQIIKKGNPQLFQQEDEIEVDIDSVDLETLWELDRFVTNYKNLSTLNAEAAQASAVPEQSFQENVRLKTLSYS